MTTAAQVTSRGVDVLFPPGGGCEVKMAKGVQTAEFELYKPIDEQMGFHEKLRLLYVACTRARDHLVVSVHRRARTPDPSDRRHWMHAELLWEAAQHATWSEPGAAADVDADFDVDGGAEVVAPAPSVSLGLDPEVWQAEYDRAHDRGNRRGFVSATTLAHRFDVFPITAGAADDPGLAKEGRDLELPPWNKGRYGTAIGRAVHATLQTVDLGSGAGLESTAAAQAAAEGVIGHEATIVALTRAALQSPIVQRAAARPRWREMYVAVPFDGITLEGYVDLVFRDDDGLVVVDYKTDAIRSESDLSARLAHYRVQGAAYAIGVSAATGERVDRCVFVFLSPDAVREVVIGGDELAAAIADVRVLIRSVRDDPPPLGPVVRADA
jgi:ATP-dependent exoDNAse (exonuclease V) beta subunit